eukprot:115060-Prymnesium_polylepis.1
MRAGCAHLCPCCNDMRRERFLSQRIKLSPALAPALSRRTHRTRVVSSRIQRRHSRPQLAAIVRWRAERPVCARKLGTCGVALGRPK